MPPPSLPPRRKTPGASTGATAAPPGTDAIDSMARCGHDANAVRRAPLVRPRRLRRRQGQGRGRRQEARQRGRQAREGRGGDAAGQRQGRAGRQHRSGRGVHLGGEPSDRDRAGAAVQLRRADAPRDDGGDRRREGPRRAARGSEPHRVPERRLGQGQGRAGNAPGPFPRKILAAHLRFFDTAAPCLFFV